MSIKSFLKNISLVITSLILVLLFFELFFHLVPYLKQHYAFERLIIQDPQEYLKSDVYRPSRLLGYERTPNCHKWVNSFGLIGADFNLKKDAGIYRILILGDSIVEQNYFIEYLKEKVGMLSSNIKFEFINAGVPGYNIWQNANFLKYKGIKFDPDMVIVSLCLGAFSPGKMICYRAEERIVVAQTASPNRLLDLPFFNMGLLRHSYLYRLFILGVNDFLTEDEDSNHKKEGIEKIGEIRQICQRNQISCFAFIWPYLMPQNEYDEIMKYFYSSMVEALDYLEFEYIDLHKYFPNDNTIKALRIAKDDYVHPSPEGHRIAAEAIFRYLSKNGYLRKELYSKQPVN